MAVREPAWKETLRFLVEKEDWKDRETLLLGMMLTFNCDCMEWPLISNITALHMMPSLLAKNYEPFPISTLGGLRENVAPKR